MAVSMTEESLIDARDTVVEAVGVFKSFSGLSPVLGPCDLSLRAGEVVAVVGASGAGKTTLLQIMAGLLKPDRGEVRFDGAVLRRPSPKIAVVFQDYGLFPWRTAWRNVAFPLEVAGIPRAHRRDQAFEALASVGLTDAAGKYPHQLSGGMRQRTALARALVGKPSVLLLDEPMSALDIVTKRSLQRLVHDVVRSAKLTTLIVTHDLMDAVRMADRAVVLAGRPGVVRADHVIDRSRSEHDRVTALSEVVECAAGAAEDWALSEAQEEEASWVLTEDKAGG